MNETLRRALFRSGLDDVTVAARLGVDPKTVRRWLDGRMPYPRLRWQLASLLGADETDLWPELAAARNAHARPSEVIAVYPHRRSIHCDIWYQLFSSANDEIAILCYSGLFIAEDAQIVGLLTAKAEAGVRIRVALFDPDAPQTAQRGSQQVIDATAALGIRQALSLYQPIVDAPNTEIRLHRVILYNSLYRADDEMFVNQHMYGIAAVNSPVLHLRSDGMGEMCNGYLRSFESIWASAVTLRRP